MMSDESVHPLVAGWRRCDVETAPFYFPDDRLGGTKNNGVERALLSSHREYVQSPLFGSRKDSSLHLGLLPVPYLGNLERASIFVLMLNPGLGAGDYFAEYEVPGYREALISNLRQENGQNEYPFFALDPRLAWTGAFAYWHDRLRRIVEELVWQRQLSYLEALSLMAIRVACVQLFPYHSRSFKAHALAGRVESSRLAQQYVHEVLAPRAAAGEITIVVARQGEKWGLDEGENVVVYRGGECRGAYLGPRTRGGKAIMRQLGLNRPGGY